LKEEEMTQEIIPQGKDRMIRIKKALCFIEGVLASYESGTYDHLGFSHAIAISKSQELLREISPLCPMYDVVIALVSSLKGLGERRSAPATAWEAIWALDRYFHLDEVDRFFERKAL